MLSMEKNGDTTTNDEIDLETNTVHRMKNTKNSIKQKTDAVHRYEKHKNDNNDWKTLKLTSYTAA